LFFFCLTTQGHSAKVSGYTYFQISDCGPKIEDEFGSYCAAVVSPVIYVKNCNASQHNGCKE
jgi:hypothetical protein